MTDVDEQISLLINQLSQETEDSERFIDHFMETNPTNFLLLLNKIWLKQTLAENVATKAVNLINKILE